MFLTACPVCGSLHACVKGQTNDGTVTTVWWYIIKPHVGSGLLSSIVIMQAQLLRIRQKCVLPLFLHWPGALNNAIYITGYARYHCLLHVEAKLPFPVSSPCQVESMHGVMRSDPLSWYVTT